MEVIALVAVLVIAGSVGLGLYLQTRSWKNRALSERTQRQMQEEAKSKQKDLQSETDRSDKEALEKWRNNFGD